MSNMNMNISIDFIKTKNKIENGLGISKKNLKNYMYQHLLRKYFHV